MIAFVTPLQAGAKQELLNARFLTAAAAGHVPAVKVLLGDGANINIRGAHNETALSQACREGRLEMAFFLMDHGASLDPQQSKIMLCGNPAMLSDALKLLAERGFAPGRRGIPGNLAVENYW